MKSEEEIIETIRETMELSKSSLFSFLWGRSNSDKIVSTAGLEIDLGLTSLDRMTFIILVEKKFNLPKDFLYNHYREGKISTIGDIVKIIQSYEP